MKTILGIAVWAWLPGFIARKKGRSFWVYYFLSFVITPLITTIITLCLRKKNAEDEQVSIPAEMPAAKSIPPELPAEFSNREQKEPVESQAAVCAATRKIMYCRRCGSKLIEGSEFCSNCGNQIEKEGVQ